MDKFIGLGIITVAIIAAIIVIIWLVKFTSSFAEHIKYGYGKNPKPWLRKKEWVNKKVIWKGLVRGSLVFAVFAIAIFPILTIFFPQRAFFKIAIFFSDLVILI